MSWGAPVRLVAIREIQERLRGRIIWVTTALITVLVVAAIVVPAVLHQPPKPIVVGLVGRPAQRLSSALKQTAASADVNVKTMALASPSQARREVREGKVDAAVVLAGPGLTVTVQQDLSSQLRVVLEVTATRAQQVGILAEARVPPAVITHSLAPASVRTKVLNPPTPDRTGRAFAAAAAGILLYVALLANGGSLAASAAQEKTSRIAEVLLSVLRPSQLLTGKVIGVGLCGLGQLTVVVVAGLLANAAVGSSEVPSTLWALLPATLLWFLLGFALYGLALAAAGSLVARQEDVQAVTMPFTIMLVGAYLLTYAAVADPTAAWVRPLSFLPPLAPILMPVRIALGHVGWWEVLVASLLMLAAIAGMARLAGRIYASSLITSGPRIRWRAALRAKS
jgi:ABC-2 type transport system permease protein